MLLPSTTPRLVPGASHRRVLRAGTDWTTAVVVGLTLLAVAVRMYHITAPLLDGYHERQAQTAMVTRNLYRDGLNFLYTRYDYLQGNPPGYGILEFPLHNLVSAVLYEVLGVHDVIGRLVSVAFAAGSVPLMFILARHFEGRASGLAATAIFAFSMTNIYLGRAVMPESPMMFFVVAGMAIALRWIEAPRWRSFLLSVVLLATAFLAKTPTVLLLLPLSVACIQRFGRNAVLRPRFLLLGTLALVPVVLWSWHAARVDALYMPSQQPQSFVFARGGDVWLRVRPALYLSLARSFLLLLTPAGAILFGIGSIVAARRGSFAPLFAWIGAWVLFIYAIPELNMQHTYYQAPMLPPMAVIAGTGATTVVRWLRQRSAVVLGSSYLAVAGLLIVQLATYAYFFREAYDVSERLPYHLLAATIVRERTPPRTVLALYDDGGGTVLSYYGDRKAWGYGITAGSDGITELEELRQRGATAFVAVDSSYATPVQDASRHPALWTYLAARYTQIAVGQHFAIYDLAG